MRAHVTSPNLEESDIALAPVRPSVAHDEDDFNLTAMICPTRPLPVRGPPRLPLSPRHPNPSTLPATERHTTRTPRKKNMNMNMKNPAPSPHQSYM